jgi:hypothetical protein
MFFFIFLYSVNIADSYDCGKADGVTGCASDKSGYNIVCHCDKELCNVFGGGTGRIGPENVLVIVASISFIALTKYFKF